MEIELKAGLAREDAARLARRLTREVGPASVARLDAIYYDSADRRLHRAGIALRVRREGGRPVQTAKTDRATTGGFSRVVEADAVLRSMHPMVDAVPDPLLRRHMHGLLAGAPLEPWFETRIARRSWQLRHPGGLVEVALDRGAIHAGAARLPVLEAEFELLAGSPEAVFALACDLLGETAANLGLPNKAARGAMLAQGAAWQPQPAGSKPARPPADLPAAEGVRQALDRLAPAVAANLACLFARDDPEGPHQLRVSLRRLRAAVGLYRPLIDRDIAERLTSRARDIGRIVAPLRDCDVLAALHADAAPGDPALAAALQQHAAAVRQEVRAALKADGATDFGLWLLGLAALGGWQRAGRAGPAAVEQLAQAALADRWRKARNLGDRLAALPDEARHELRKELKKLRYLSELAPINLSDRFFTSRLKRLQEELGRLNDFAVLESWSPTLAPDAARRLAEVRARLLKSAQSSGDLALGRACRHWRELRACPHPWQRPLAAGPCAPR